jgi:hypothetical protein
LKITAIALSAAFVGLLSITPASAVPSSAAIKNVAAQDGGVVHAQYKYKRKGYRKGHHKGYRAGRHYRHAPSGWRRYSSRPYGWQTRGCVVVGPVWFCP